VSTVEPAGTKAPEEAAMTIEDLSARVERLERANRRLKAAGALGLVLAFGVAATGQIIKPRDEVRGGSFVAIEPGGKACVSMSAGPLPGSGGLAFLDREGKARCSLDSWGEDSKLEIREKGGDVQALVVVEKDGSAGVRVSDSQGRLRAEIGVRANGDPALVLYDKEGKPVFRAPQ
jgi:hypothetical protein